MKERDYRYRNKKWQKYQYIDLKKTIKEIGEICGVSNGTIQYWLRKFKIEIRSLSKALKGRTLSEEHKQNISNSKKGKKQSEKTKKQISESIKKLYLKHPEKWIQSKESKKKRSEKMKGKNMRDKSPNWKGDNAKYDAIHNNIRKNKPKPKDCEDCGKPENYDIKNGYGKLELSNSTGKLIRDINNFRWVHQSCHIKYDKENKIIHEGLLTKSIITINQNTLFKLRIAKAKIEKKLNQKHLNWKDFFEEIIKMIEQSIK